MLSDIQYFPAFREMVFYGFLHAGSANAIAIIKNLDFREILITGKATHIFHLLKVEVRTA